MPVRLQAWTGLRPTVSGTAGCSFSAATSLMTWSQPLFIELVNWEVERRAAKARETWRFTRQSVRCPGVECSGRGSQ
ncbi:hypothetical protein GCM10022222_08790 [Amycolatopsis ultiminotia]|uniref:Secreted protein n=1 Tax=Amycolatopsis ultiminotia TaxID=543629 RepID=A0ABP6V437_9PSEU